MMSRPRLAAIPFLAAVLLGDAGTALAHPHVQVSVRTVVVLDEQGQIAVLRHTWKFDEAFSSFSTAGLDKNKDGKLNREELADLAKINVESLHEYGFFSHLKKSKTTEKGRTPTGFGAVRDYYLSHDGKSLTLHFTLPIEKSRLAIREAKLEIYDPSYFVAFEFEKDAPVTVEGGGLACAAQVGKLNAAVTSRLSQLSESFFQSMNSGGGTSTDWAIPVQFACK